MRYKNNSHETGMKPLILGFLTCLSLLAVSFFMTGCGTLGKMGSDSLNARQQWNVERMQHEAEMFKKPVIDFQLSASAAQALGNVERTVDAEGNEVPAIALRYTPERRFSDYYESPAWRLLPSGDALLWGGITVWQLDRNHSIQQSQIQSADRREERRADSNDRMIDAFIANQPQPE